MHVYGSYVTRVVSIAAFATLGVGCATVAPTELVRAREAYQRSTLGLAAARAPAELHKAKASLDKAEESFAEEPTSRRTRDLSYVAERKAQLADAIAEARRADRSRAEAEQEYLTRQQRRAQQTSKALADTRGELADTERSRQAGSRALGTERAARLGAEAKAKEAAEALAKLAAVKEEERGLVITLSGSVLFASNQATLLPSAQTRLNQVADVLLTTKERTLVVEGHTDSQGTSGYNLGLSQRRADAVRTYLISRGYASDLIRARGFGKERPVTENSSVEGRANNRRVEIVIEPKLKASL